MTTQQLQQLADKHRGTNISLFEAVQREQNEQSTTATIDDVLDENGNFDIEKAREILSKDGTQTILKVYSTQSSQLPAKTLNSTTGRETRYDKAQTEFNQYADLYGSDITTLVQKSAFLTVSRYLRLKRKLAESQNKPPTEYKPYHLSCEKGEYAFQTMDSVKRFCQQEKLIVKNIWRD